MSLHRRSVPFTGSGGINRRMKQVVYSVREDILGADILGPLISIDTLDYTAAVLNVKV